MISRRADDAWGFMIGAGLAGYASYSAITHTVTKHSSNVIIVGESGDLGAAVTALLFLLGAFVMGYSIAREKPPVLQEGGGS